MTGAAIRRFALRLLAGLLVAVGSLAVVTVAPIQVYKPSCGRPYPLVGRPKISGPLRPAYVDMFTRLMRQEGFRYWRLGDMVLVPMSPVFDGNERWDWNDFTLNMEWRVAYSIANGYTADGCAPTLEAVRRLFGNIEGSCGRPVERTPDGRRISPPTFWIEDDCNLFRAAVVRVEDMPQPLPVLERFSALRDKRTGPPQNAPAPQAP